MNDNTYNVMLTHHCSESGGLYLINVEKFDDNVSGALKHSNFNIIRRLQQIYFCGKHSEHIYEDSEATVVFHLSINASINLNG